MTAKIEIETPDVDRAAIEAVSPRKTWIVPGYQKFSVRGSETANSNSNFDGTNYSS